MATLATAINFARAQTQTDSNGITDANGIIYANEALLDIHRSFIFHGIDASQVQEAYQDGSANVGTYLYPTDMFLLKAVELNYTDTNPVNYLTAQQIDVSNLAGDASFSWLRANQSNRYPKIDDRGDWFEIFPTPTSSSNLTKLMRIFYFLEPIEYTTTADTISYPISLDYRLLGWRIASSYMKSLMKWNESAGFEAEYEKHLSQVTKILSKGVQQPLQATPIQNTGWNF